MNATWKFIILFAGLTLFNNARATPVTVPNFSFEDPALSDGLSTANNAPIPDWNIENPGFLPNAAGTFNPTSAYPGSTGDTSPLPGTGEGFRAAYLRFSATTSPLSISLVSAASLATVDENTRYTLTVALGNRVVGEQHPFDGTIELLVNGAVAATLTTNASSLPQGTFTDFSTSFITSVGDPRSGGNLTVRLVESKPAGPVNNFTGDFDNVRLDATVLPPPPVLNIGVYAGIEITGATGLIYRIDFAEPLSPTNWITLTNITLPSSPFFFVDKTSAANHGNRFYRAVIAE